MWRSGGPGCGLTAVQVDGRNTIGGSKVGDGRADGARELGLDCASTMFVLGRHEGREYLIRLSAMLREPIDPGVLQTALDRTINQYPYFFVRFGAIGKSLAERPVEHGPRIQRKTDTSVLALGDDDDGCEAQVTYEGKTIFFEYFHGVSDGMGGLVFLQRLLAEYLSQGHDDGRIMDAVPAMPLQEQGADGYRISARGVGGTGLRGVAYRIKGTPATTSITTYCLSAVQVRERAAEHSASVAEYLAALLCIAINDLRRSSPGAAGHGATRLTVPVNLRPRLGLSTTRNCTLNVYPELPYLTEDPDVQLVCKRFRSYMATATRPEKLAARCLLMSRLGGSGLANALPVSFRRRLVRGVLNSPFTGGTMTFSNMGAVSMPEALREHVIELGMAFSARPEAPYSCSVISLGDRMRLTLLRTTQEPLLEGRIERVMFAQGIDFVMRA